MEDVVITNNENNDDDSPASDIDAPQKILWKLKEWTE